MCNFSPGGGTHWNRGLRRDATIPGGLESPCHSSANGYCRHRRLDPWLLTCTLREQKEHAHTSNSTLFRPPRGRDEGRRGRTDRRRRTGRPTDRTSQKLKSGICNIEARNVANKSTPLRLSLKDLSSLGVHQRHDPHHRSNDRLCEEMDRTCTCTPGASTHTGGGRRTGGRAHEWSASLVCLSQDI